MNAEIYQLLEKIYDEFLDIKSTMITKDDIAEMRQELQYEILELDRLMDHYKDLFDGFKAT